MLAVPLSVMVLAAAAVDGKPQERVARAALAQMTREHPVLRGAIVVLDAQNGKILAAVGSGPDGDDQVNQPIEVGSTLKPFTVAAALENGLDPAQRFDGENGVWNVGGTELRDWKPFASLDAREVLIRSSNIGAAKIAAVAVAGDRLPSLLRSLQFSSAPREWSGGRGQILGAGIGFFATPLELAAAYAAIASGGVFAAPTRDGSGTPQRVMSAKTASQLTEMLESAVGQGTGQRAAVKGIHVAGKTGTVRGADGTTWGHFVGFFPAERPRFVVAVTAQVNGDGYTGGTVAAPAFARIAQCGSRSVDCR